jgi:acetoin utilization deacetylase AcuC-like enzyme
MSWSLSNRHRLLARISSISIPGVIWTNLKKATFRVAETEAIARLIPLAAWRGVCLLGNTPVAIKRARALGQVGRVAVLDWDVHHGNSTQSAFYDEPDVFTLSIHQAGNYPLDTGAFEEQGEGAGLSHNLNAPMPPSCGIGAFSEMTEQTRTLAEHVCDGRLVMA